jgi:hypothetical protein
MITKKCKYCLNIKPVVDFYKSNKNNFQSYCKVCNKNQHKLHNDNCLYKVTYGGDILYIGITENLVKRKINHKSKLKKYRTFNGSKVANPLLLEDIDRWVWEVIIKDTNYVNLKIKEIELIVEYKPIFNSPYREFYEQNLDK